MTPLLEVVQLLGRAVVQSEIPMLMAAQARSRQIIQQHGLLYGDDLRTHIDEIATADSSDADPVRAAYYLGLEIGWRAAQRFR